jgi:hypothetical protein
MVQFLAAQRNRRIYSWLSKKRLFRVVLAPNICHFNFFTPTLTIRLIQKVKVMKKSNIYLNYIIVKIHNNCTFYFK